MLENLSVITMWYRYVCPITYLEHEQDGVAYIVTKSNHLHVYYVAEQRERCNLEERVDVKWQ